MKEVHESGEEVCELRTKLEQSRENLELCREMLEGCYPSEWPHWSRAVAAYEREVARLEGRVTLR